MTTDLEKGGLSDDAEFERWLLDSAREDELPSAAPAFDKLSATLALVAFQAAPTPLASPVGGAPSRALKLKWLIAGAVGGSALTALWLGVQRSPSQSAHLAEPSAWVASTAPAVEAPLPTRQAPRAAQPRTPSSNELEGQPLAESRSLRSDAPHRTTSSKRLGAGSSALSASPRGSAARSTLLAEIATLDAVRAKLARSDAAGALQLLQSYERKFPEGQLASDAAVLSMEALQSVGNRAEVERRAAAFLQRSPDDPHAARVRSLANE